MNRANGHVTIQIAETRFAIQCDYTPFMDWLKEACGNFLVDGEPHAKLSLNFEVADTGMPVPNFKLGHIFNVDETRYKIIWPNLDKPDELYRTLLRTCLHLAPVTKQPPDLWLHAAAIIHNNEAFIFTGMSGSGKTTITNILSKEAGFTILHDESVVVSQTGKGFQAWSSPVRGQRPADHCMAAPLRALFFINQSKTNHASRLSGRKALGLLSPNVILLPRTRTQDGKLVNSNRDTLEMMMRFIETVSCYELHFKPDFSFWECIEQYLREGN